VQPEHEAAFNRYYHNHVPTLLEIPGYAWGRRYVHVMGDRKYLALYQIDDATCLERLLGPGPEARDPIANSEFARFEALEGVGDVRINVYQQLSGTHLGHPLLEADYPISVVAMDCVDPAREAEFNEWYTHSHVPNLVREGDPVYAYTDLLLHDMGPALADGVTQGLATASEFRTTPLWGVRHSAPYLHDGRADTLESAILLHGGEAQAIRDASPVSPENTVVLGYAQGFTGYSLTPEDWVSGLGEDQERHTYPPTLTAPDSSGTSSMTAPRN